nr:hypothetical protein [Tanacetum cinerariifolium]
MERAATTASSLEVEQDSGNINMTQSIATLNEPLPQGTGSGSGPSSTMASAIICPANNQKFNFSKYIFDNMMKHLERGVKFLMFLRFLQGFSGNVTPLFEIMMVNAQEEVGEGSGLHTDSHHTPTNIQPSSSKPQKKIKPKRKQSDQLPSGEDSIQLNELMIFYTNLQQHILDLQEAKTAQAKEIANLKKRVKKLEKKRNSRPAGLRRLKKGRMHDADMFGDDDLKGNEVIVDVREKIVEKEVSTAGPVTTACEVVTAASVKDSVAPTTATTINIDDELTLEKTLIVIKAAKPKDKGKAKMIEPEKPLKKKDQIALDEEVARKLEAKMKAEMEDEERIAREKDEANRVVIKEWDDV